MKARYIDPIFAGVVAITAFQFYYTWVERMGPSYLHNMAYSLDGRPFVYRLLIPALSRAASWTTNIDAVYCMVFLFVLSAVGLYFSLKYLYTAFKDDDRSSLVAFIGCELLFLLMLHEPHIYDLATCMFFALALALLERGKFNLYYLLFIFATLNRETTFLLILFFAAHYIGRLPRGAYFLGLAYQGIVYVLIRGLVTWMFASANGVAFLFRPAGVISGYLDKPVQSILLFAILIVVIWLVLRGWNEKPQILRTAFLTIFPAVLVLHLLVGYAFEIRVLIEAVPAAFVLSTYYSGRTEQTKPERQLRSQRSPHSL